jgi:hypothetical protein
MAKEPPRARGAGDPGPAKAESPALFLSLCRHGTVRSAGKLRPAFVTLSRAPPRLRRRVTRSRHAAPLKQAGAAHDESRGRVCRPIPPSPFPETAAPIYRQSDG